MVQRRAARFVLNRYNKTDSVNEINEMLEQLNWVPLQDRRLNAKIATLYNIYNNKIPSTELKAVLNEPLFFGKNDHSNKLCIIPTNTMIFHNSFFPSSIREWNKLPAEIICSNSKSILMNKLKEQKKS